MLVVAYSLTTMFHYFKAFYGKFQMACLLCNIMCALDMLLIKATYLLTYLLTYVAAGKLWTAPEILRENNPPRRGTQRGDVYSYSIICYEIMMRTEPYNFDNITPRGTHSTPTVRWLVEQRALITQGSKTVCFETGKS